MTHWNHRIVKFKYKDGYEYYGICEVHYNNKEEIYGRTDPIEVEGETLENLKETLKWMLVSFDFPVLIDGEIPYGDIDG